MNKLILIVLAVSVSAAFAVEPDVTVLDNGLTVITQELHYAPVVASVVSYGVGSRHETPDIMGISHFVEHMMFKGTEIMPKSRFWQIVQRDGGQCNAQEGEDVTWYYLLLPANRIEDALMIESDRMVNCTIDSAEVVSEINVVHEERRMRFIDSADGALMEALYEMAFTEHPYGQPVLGYDENILGYTHGMARSFYKTYYFPSNAVLTIVGDFNTEELLAKIDDYFGNIPSGSVPEESVAAEPEQTEAGYVEIEHASNLPRFAMSFHSTAGTDSYNPAMTMIAAYLYGGRSGRLSQLLVETNLVYSARVSKNNRIDPGLFTIYVTMNPPEDSEVTVEQVQDIIWNELEYLAENGIPEETLNEQRNRYRAREILGNSYPLSLAVEYALSYSKFGNPLYRQEQMELIEQLTPADISEAASMYFRRNGVNIAVLVPSETAGAEASGGREELPTSMTEPESIDYDGLEIPEEFLTPPERSIADGVQEYELENGIVLLVREDHTFPVVSINFSIPVGSMMHSTEQNGLASVTTETMMRGTKDLENIEFHRRLEIEGSYLRLFSGMENSIGFITLLSEDLETGFITVADLLRRPAFRESDFENVMSDKYARLSASAENLFSVAFDNLTAITAYSPADITTVTRETLDRINLDDVISLYDICCRPEGTVITFVGDIDPEEVYGMTQSYFGDWNNPEEPLPSLTVSRYSTAPGDTVVTFMPGRTQAAVMISRNAPGTEMPDYPAFRIMNTILGSSLGSRLGHSVRDEQGLAYGVGSWVGSMDSTGYFTAYLTTLADMFRISNFASQRRIQWESRPFQA
jgi:zinc protease